MIDDHKVITTQDECDCCSAATGGIFMIPFTNSGSVGMGGVTTVSGLRYMEVTESYESGGPVVYSASSQFVCSLGDYSATNTITTTGSGSGAVTGTTYATSYTGQNAADAGFDAIFANGAVTGTGSGSGSVAASYFKYNGWSPPSNALGEVVAAGWRWKAVGDVPPDYAKVVWDVVKIVYATTAGNPPLPSDDIESVTILDEDLEWIWPGIANVDPDAPPAADDPDRFSGYYDHMNYLDALSGPYPEDKFVEILTVNIRRYTQPRPEFDPLGWFWDGATWTNHGP